MNPISPRQRIWFVGGLAVLLVASRRRLDDAASSALSSFAGGHTVTLAAYKGPSPVGVPAELSSADLVTRGKYLTQAADCEVCHTTEGGQAFRRRPRVPDALWRALLTEHHGGPRNGNRRLD